MNQEQRFAVSCLLESAGREDFAIHLYSRQHHRDPFATVPMTPQYFVLDEVYHIKPVPVIISDLLGIVEIENVHRQWFLEAAEALNPDNEPVPRIVFPEDLFDPVEVPQADPVPGMKSVLQALITNIVQEQRADLIYRYFSRETSGPVSDLFADVAEQEQAHRRIFEKALTDACQGKKITMWCPVCGKILSLEPRPFEPAGCGFCRSRFTLGMESGDFVLLFEKSVGDSRRTRIPRP